MGGEGREDLGFDGPGLLALSGAHVRVHELASELRLRDQVKQLGLPDGFRLGEGEPHRIRLLGALGPLGECSGRHQRLGCERV